MGPAMKASCMGARWPGTEAPRGCNAGFALRTAHSCAPSLLFPEASPWWSLSNLQTFNACGKQRGKTLRSTNRTQTPRPPSSLFSRPSGTGRVGLMQDAGLSARLFLRDRGLRFPGARRGRGRARGGAGTPHADHPPGSHPQPFSSVHRIYVLRYNHCITPLS